MNSVASPDTTVPRAENGASQSDDSQELVRIHRRRVARRWLVIASLMLLAFAGFVAIILIGPLGLSVGDVFRGIFRPESLTAQEYTVIWTLRLPVAVLAILVGMILSLAGAQMQTILDNPLAEPFTLGISAAAACGAGASVVFGWTIFGGGMGAQLSTAMMAWIASMVASGIIIMVSIVKGGSSETMILLGIGMVFFFQAMLSIIQYTASAEALQAIVFWTMGSLTRATWEANAVLAIILCVALPIFSILSWKLTALRLGEDRAAAMGVDVSRLRILVLFLVSLLAATTVAFTGVIGFIGLVGPHIARILVGEDQRYFIPASMAAGACVMTIAHAVSLLIIPGLAIPISILTSLIGVPFFIMIVITRRGK